MQKNNSNSKWYLLLGAAAGVATGFWLNSNQGRAWRKETSHKLNEAAKKVSDGSSEKFEEIKAGFNSIIETSQKQVNDLATKAKDFTKEYTDKTEEIVEERVDHIESAYEKGARKAKAHINNIELS